MKKFILMIVGLLLLAGCGSSAVEDETVRITNPIGLALLEAPADMSGYVWLEDEEPAFVEISLAESIRLYTEKGSGIVVYSRTGCPWCQRAIPVLNEAAKELGVTLYYVDVQRRISDDPDEGNAIFNSLVSHIESTFELDADGTPIFQIPLVLAVKDGEILDHHLSLVEGFTLSSEDVQMDEKQTAELKNIYKTLIKSAAD